MENRDENLWRIAKKRAGFKRHLAAYIIINGFLWIMWLMTMHEAGMQNELIPWPLWSTVGWGIGLAFNYYGAYLENRDSTTMREYEKLKGRDKE